MADYDKGSYQGEDQCTGWLLANQKKNAPLFSPTQPNKNLVSEKISSPLTVR